MSGRARATALDGTPADGVCMSVLGGERLLEDVWDAASSAGGPAARRLFERVAVALRRSAAILRANRKHAEAARAEEFAVRLGLGLDEPEATRRMHALAEAVHECSHAAALLERALDGAMSLIGSDLGNIQIRDVADGTLRIAAHAGFGSEFLEYFADVRDDSSACGRAASRWSQPVIVDVNADAAFAPHREIASAARFRAVQSTPLLDAHGRLRGVISTHFRRPQCPTKRDLQLMQWYGEHVAAALARQQNGRTALNQASGAGFVTPVDGVGIRVRAGGIDGAERAVRV